MRSLCFDCLILVPCVFSTLLAGAVEVKLQKLGTFRSESREPSACEIVKYDAGSKRAFVTSAALKAVLILDLSDPTQPKEVGRIEMGAGKGVPNSVAVHAGLVAIAVEAANKTEPGEVWFADSSGTVLSKVKVGAQPDMLTFTPDGKRVLTANEGEPTKDLEQDPEGSISIVDLPADARQVTQDAVRTADFRAFDRQNLPKEVILSNSSVSVSQDLEPEYIALSADGKRAYVTLQENNALAFVDVEQAKVVAIRSLGFKDHSSKGNGLDTSDKSDDIEIKERPLFGAYQPDSILLLSLGGKDYLVTANEGDQRDWAGEGDAVRVEDIKLNPSAFRDAESLQKKKEMGRLRVMRNLGDDDGDDAYEKLFSFGARSISVWGTDGVRVWDSGDDLEQTIARELPKFFNTDHEKDDSRKSRSVSRGPEPEALAYGQINGVPLVFAGLERASAVVCYDLRNPGVPKQVGFQSLRNYQAPLGSPESADSGPEGLEFIPAEQSPNHQPLLLVASEVSNTVSVFQAVLK